jgi:DNA polymerase-3 subunit gamma/tau
VPRIVEHLRDIVAREGVQSDEEALELVARRAGGSMRDAQSLLDQLLAFGGDHLTTDQVHALLGTAGDERIVALAETVLAHEVKKTLDLLDEAVVTGLQLGELLDQMIAYWRDLMVVHCAGVEGRDLSVPSRHRETLLRQAKALNLDAILAGLDILSVAKAQLKSSNHGRTLVEMALVRLSRLENLVALPYLVRLLNSQRSAAAVASGPLSVAPPEGVKKKFPDPAPEIGTSQQQPLTPSNLPEIWAQTLRKLPGLLARSLEKGGLPAIFAPNNLVLRSSIDYNGAKDLVEAALKDLTGQRWSLQVEDISDAANLNSPGVASPRRNAREEAEKLPLVKRAIDVLGASLQRVDEGFGSISSGGTNADDPPREDDS